MQGQRYWIKSGSISFQDARFPVSSKDEHFRMHHEGQLRLTTGPLGTELKWDVHSPCFSSVMLALNWLEELAPPYILRYHVLGWFEETYSNALAAIERLQEIMARGDRHIVSRAFVRPSNAANHSAPKVIQECLEKGSPFAEFSIDCPFDERTGQFAVTRVGPQSAIGKVWGTYTTSQPCNNKGGYSDVVTEVYSHVMETGKPHYDQVIALLCLPNSARHWVPYHRVVFARRDDAGIRGVSVVSQIASVDFKVI